MRALLDNRLAPLTFAFAFLEAQIAAIAPTFAKWRRTHSSNVGSVEIDGNLPELLQMLPPLTGLKRRELFVETKSRWTAYFSNELPACDPVGVTSYLCDSLKIKGVAIRNIPHTLTEQAARKGEVGTFGAVQFQLFSASHTNLLNTERVIGVTYDAGRWRFDNFGARQPCEKDENYTAKLIREKFTPSMLEQYCAALGIRLFDASFYGPKATLFTVTDPLPDNGKGVTLDQARREIGLGTLRLTLDEHN